MKLETFLAAYLGDWYEADDALTRCEDLWQSTNASYRERDAAEDDEIVQEGLQDIRELLDGVRSQHAALPYRIEYRGGDVDVTEEDEEDWGFDVDMMEYKDDAEADDVESDADEQDDEDEEMEPSDSSEANKDVGFKSGVGSLPELSLEKDASNSNKAIADTQSTTDTKPTDVERIASTAPIIPKLGFSVGQFLAPEFHEAIHHDANNATAVNKTTDNTTDNKITDSKTYNTELGENKPEAKLEPDGTRESGENSPKVKIKTESKELE